MKVLITGICGFVGSTIAREIRHHFPNWELVGIDNFSRPGSLLNKPVIERELEIQLFHEDIRNQSAVDSLPKCDWILDAAAIPSVLAGVDGKTSSRQLIEHNLYGTVNLLEYCKRHQSGFILLSTSRVYSIPGLAGLQMDYLEKGNFRRFSPNNDQVFPAGIDPNGISEAYSTEPPVSLYGSSKVSSEHLALEYGKTFGFPVWINRCGVLAGAGQFGQAAQGIFAFWIHSFREGRPLKYIGFGGKGYQVRDCLHPKDLLSLLDKQFNEPPGSNKCAIVNVSGGLENSMSLRELSDWCQARYPSSPTEIGQDTSERPFDIPWVILNSALSSTLWGWQPTTSVYDICGEIADYADENPDWLLTSTH